MAQRTSVSGSAPLRATKSSTAFAAGVAGTHDKASPPRVTPALCAERVRDPIPDPVPQAALAKGGKTVRPDGIVTAPSTRRIDDPGRRNGVLVTGGSASLNQEWNVFTLSGFELVGTLAGDPDYLLVKPQ